MTWLIMILLYVLGNSISNILRRVVMKDEKSDAFTSVVIFQFMGFIMATIFCLFKGFTLPPIAKYPFNFITQAVLWGLSSLLLFKASKELEASEVTIISTVTSIATIITAVLFLHEAFNLVRLLGVVLIIFSVILVSLNKGKLRFNRGVWYALASSICGGIAITNDTFILQTTDVYSMLVIGWLTPGLFLLATNPKIIKKINYFFNYKKFMKMFLMTLFYTFSGIAFYLAIAMGGQASQVTPIGQASIITTIILASLFLRERDHLPKKMIAAILVTLGVLLLR